MPQGISFSNLFVDITNKRQQQTSQQLSQITGAIDQIAAHKKQTRLATERDDLLKDNREYQEQKQIRSRQSQIYDKYGSIFSDVDEKEFSNIRGEGEWNLDTLDQLSLYGQDLTETKEATAKISGYEQKLGEKVQYDKDLGYYVERKDKAGKTTQYDADVLIGEKKLTVAGTPKMTSTEKNQREWYSDRGKNYPANNIEAKKIINKVQDVEENISKFEGSSAAKMREGTEVIDGGIYTKLTPEEYKTKTTWFMSPTTKKGVKRNKAKIIEKGGEHFLPVTATDVSTKLGMSSTNAAKVYNEMVQNIKDVEFMEEFNVPDQKVEPKKYDPKSVYTMAVDEKEESHTLEQIIASQRGKEKYKGKSDEEIYRMLVGEGKL